MVLTYLPDTLVPVAVSIATVAVIVYTLINCVCSKRNKKDDPELSDVKVHLNSSTQSPDSLKNKGTVEQNNVGDPGGIQLDLDTAVIPLDQGPKQNGTLHSRGNSADLTKPDRHSGTSAGSSPRQATLSRELPDIPVQIRDKTNHTHLPEVPSGVRQSTFKPDSASRGAHSHAQLPEIPQSSPERASRGVNLQEVTITQRNKSPTIPRSSAESKTSVVRLSQEVPITQSDSKSSELDDYDHITESKPRKLRPRSDYDHVLIDGNQKRIIPARHVEDPDYAEVRNENIYEGVPDDVTVVPVKVKTPVNVTQTKTKTSIIVGKAPVKETCVDDPPYNRIKDDSPGPKDSGDPPYNKIKDDPSYNGVKDTDPYNKVKDDDPYNKVRGEDEIDDLDPYNTVIDTDSEKPKRKFPLAKTKSDGPSYDPYAFVDEERDVSNQSNVTDPYARVCDTEIDDPYNKVIDEEVVGSGAKVAKKSNTNDVDKEYAVVNKVGRVEYATVNKLSVRRKAAEGGASGTQNEGKQNAQPRYASNEYSTVMKFRQENLTSDTNTPVAGTSQTDRTVAPRASQPPAEPPRDYDDDVDDDGSANTDADHYNTVSQLGSGQTAAVTTAATTTLTTTTTTTTTATTSLTDSASGARKKEPPYTKLSARESLASMNARLASNTYEMVSEVDNLYATVEGGSGDGVVRQEAERQVVPGSSSELYAEITDNVAAPAPPSLDSLHETAKQQSNQRTPLGHCRTPSGQGHIRTPSGQGHFRTPSGDNNSGTVEARATLATEEIVDLGPHSYSKEAVTPDELEYDPNYETVEEARSRAKYEEINGATKLEKKIRAHVYEEVTVTNEARRTRQRVLNLHTYEDITDVKDMEGNNKTDEVQKSKTLNGKVTKTDESEKSKMLNGKLSGDLGAAGTETKYKKSKSDGEKTKYKVKEKKKSESKDKSEKSGKSSKK